MFLKYTVCITGLLMITISANGQDLIHILEGDSINCKIQKVTRSSIYFQKFKQNQYQDTRKVSLKNVRNWKFDYFPKGYRPKNKSRRDNTSIEPDREVRVNSLFFTINAGYSYRLNNIKNELSSSRKSHIKGMSSGLNFSPSLTIYLAQNHGIGLNYSLHYFRKHSNNVTIKNPPDYYIKGDLNDKMVIQYIGPFYVARTPLSHDKDLIFDAGFGYTDYNNRITDVETVSVSQISKGIQVDSFNFIGYTLGIKTGVRFEYRLNEQRNYQVGIQYTYGKLFDTDVSFGDYEYSMSLGNENNNSISRLDFVLGYRF